MTDLEIMEKAVECTMTLYSNQYSSFVEDSSVSPEKLEMESVKYSADVLFKFLKFTPGIYAEYTTKDNLRQSMMKLSIDSIKTELLKNIVNVAAYNRIANTRAGKRIGNIFSGDLNDDEIAVILFNNLMDYGIEKAFELLNESVILASVCRSFAYYKSNERREALNSISKDDSIAIYFNNEIDVYYARFGNDQKNSGFGVKL